LYSVARLDCSQVQIVVIQSAEGRNLFVGWLALVKQQLDLRLELGFLGHFAHTASSYGVLLAVKASTIGAKGRNRELDDVDLLKHVLKGPDDVSVVTGAI